VKLGSVIDESISMLAPFTEIRKVSISKTLTDDVISGDPELLKQVLMNVFMNAIQAMPDGGKLEVVMESREESVSVSVADEGEGISPENIEKIFDPFFSTKDKGTGLGLTIAHKIMQCHDGFIKVFMNGFRGSTFRLYFPGIKKAVTNNAINRHSREPACRSGGGRNPDAVYVKMGTRI
jgi:signal transduction histidine kinase